MKDSKEKEHRISDLKDMIDNVTTESYDEMEEDSELIDYLNGPNTDFEELKIDDEFIYHPGDEYNDALNLEETPIDEDYIIKAPKSEDVKKDEYTNMEEDLVGDISENFDNVINAKIKGRPVLAIVSSIIGVVLIIISVFIFESRSDRVIDNVVAGESSFMFVIFLVIGVFLLIYGVYKLFNIKNPFEKITSSINTIDSDVKEKKDNTNTKLEEPSQKPIPKSEIPLDKESYKIGEFDVNDLKTSLKKPTASNKKVQFKETIEDLPPAKEKSLSEKEIEEMEYEHAKLESESIDDIFAEVEEIEDMPIISDNSKERKE
ncbi:sodium/calcium exchanger protein [Methanobrevibacter sp. UBA212]|uniref:sodium/calcium exchanger protein n=1 Tax=Methanobrevibacter sp. UBA212 TaxID=1915476 RepID=UPI0025FCE4BF|nr:sodium/calcium exchanger protein [Methanobrevibacter sp. UBA212]